MLFSQSDFSRRWILSFLAVFFATFACHFRCAAQETPPNRTNDRLAIFDYEIELAPEWTELFHRKSGWFGADGVFSIPLDGCDDNSGKAETLLLFSDTWIGEVGENNEPKDGSRMVNNTVAYVGKLDPDKPSIKFHYKTDTDGTPGTYFVPKRVETPKKFFWLGDGFVNRELNNTTYVFAYHIARTGENVFDFREFGVSLIAFPARARPPFEQQRQIVTPLHVDHPQIGEGNFGCAIFANTVSAGAANPDGYVYVYGCIGKKKALVVSRVRPGDFETFSKWRYWNGKDWDKDISNVAPVTDSVSNELSLTETPDGRYMLVFQVMGISEKVGMRIATSPAGPFGEIHELYSTPEAKQGLITYNAKAHPALSKQGELLISYNTITLDFWNDIRRNAHIYRPRFIRMKFK